MSHSLSTVEERLRALAPDPHHDLDPAGFAAARARLDAELAGRSSPEASGVVVLDPAQTWRRPKRCVTRRILLGAAAAAAVGVGFVLLPGPGESAFATWSPTPDVISDEERAAIVDACVAHHQESAGGGYEDSASAPSTTVDYTALVAAAAEQRGDWTFTLLVGEGGPDGPYVVADCTLGTGAWTGSGGSSTSIGDPPDPVDDSAATYEGGGTFHVYSYDGPVPWIASGATGVQSVHGLVGEDVVRVTVTFSGGPDVEATVSEPGLVASGAPRYWVAWWPSSHVGDTSFTVTGYLADGSIGSTEDVHWTTGFDPDPEEIEGVATDA